MAAVDAVAPDLGAIQAGGRWGAPGRRCPGAAGHRLDQRPAFQDRGRRGPCRRLNAKPCRRCCTRPGGRLGPVGVVATLLNEGVDLAWERTMDRILVDAGQTGERRHQPTLVLPDQSGWRPGPTSGGVGHHQAARPGEVDLRLPGGDPGRGQPLGGRLDGRPRRPGRAGRAAARRHLRQPADPPGHPDRAGRPRQLDDLHAGRVPAGRPRVTKTHSRPHVSNDNPYSQSQVTTLTYRPGVPARFGSIQTPGCSASSSSAGTTQRIATRGSR